MEELYLYFTSFQIGAALAGLFVAILIVRMRLIPNLPYLLFSLGFAARALSIIPRFFNTERVISLIEEYNPAVVAFAWGLEAIAVMAFFFAMITKYRSYIRHGLGNRKQAQILHEHLNKHKT